MKKTILLTILFLVLLVLVISLFSYSGEKTNTPNSGVKETGNPPVIVSPSGVTVTKTNDAESLPQGFPAIPLNGKEEMRASYTLDYANAKGMEQKVVDFLSSQSVEDNVSFYTKWAKENNWNTIHQSNIDKEARILLEKDARSLTITIKEDAKAGKSTINISY